MLTAKKEKLFNLAKSAFPEMMNKTEACFYLWNREDIRQLNSLEEQRLIFFTVVNGKFFVLKKTLERFLRELESKFAA